MDAFDINDAGQIVGRGLSAGRCMRFFSLQTRRGPLRMLPIGSVSPATESPPPICAPDGHRSSIQPRELEVCHSSLGAKSRSEAISAAFVLGASGGRPRRRCPSTEGADLPFRPANRLQKWLMTSWIVAAVVNRGPMMHAEVVYPERRPPRVRFWNEDCEPGREP